MPKPKSPIDMLAAQIKDAARQEVRKDKGTGRAYRAYHAVPARDAKGQGTFYWIDIDDPATTFANMRKSMVRRREQMVDDGVMLLWFRAEQREEVEWAGNPHKAVSLDPAAMLTPRTSFESWTQAVSGRSRRWTLEEIEAAHRLRRAFHDAHINQRLRLLNADLQR
ncbi:MAG: hypothetical protein EOO77_44845, partial [Oxalobacteraceae bacterium]